MRRRAPHNRYVHQNWAILSICILLITALSISYASLHSTLTTSGSVVIDVYHPTYIADLQPTSTPSCATPTHAPTWDVNLFQTDGILPTLDCAMVWDIVVRNATDDLVYIKDIITDHFNNSHMEHAFSITPQTPQSVIHAHDSLVFSMTIKYQSNLSTLPAQTDFSGQFHLVFENVRPPVLVANNNSRNFELFKGNSKFTPSRLAARFSALDDFDGNITSKITATCRQLGQQTPCVNDWVAATAPEFSITYQVTNSLGLSAPPITVNVHLWEFKKLASGTSHTMLLGSNGSLYTWGHNGDYRLGLGDTAHRTSPVKMNIHDAKIVDAAACDDSGHAVTAAGLLYSWGNGNNYSLGNYSTDIQRKPYLIRPLTGEKYVQVACFQNTSAALTDAGNVYTWGREGYGAHGHGQSGDKRAPTRVTGLTGITKISMGQYNGGAIDKNGNLFIWGTNGEGQLGVGNSGANPSKGVTAFFNRPRNYPKLTGVHDICFGAHHAIAVMNSGRVYVWGNNAYGRLGNGGSGNTHAYTPYLITPITGGAACSASTYGSSVLTFSGDVYVFGNNNYGELGTGNASDRVNFPAKIKLQNLTAVALQLDAGHVIQKGVSILGFGFNQNGELGIGTTTNTATPTPVKISAHEVVEW
jgi:alpha-tubulin suppressor-like RCC1 family protein